MRFGCPLKFILFWKHHLWPLRLCGALKPWGGKGSLSYWMTTVFLDQPLALLGSAEEKDKRKRRHLMSRCVQILWPIKIKINRGGRGGGIFVVNSHKLWNLDVNERKTVKIPPYLNGCSFESKRVNIAEC